MKRQLLIEVDCGNRTCGNCDYRKQESLYKWDSYICEMFQMGLEDGCVRDEQCLAAEARAKAAASLPETVDDASR